VVADHRPGPLRRGATLGHWNWGRSESPEARTAQPDFHQITGSHLLEHCERARLWR
jgi:hypothetical protein